MLTRCEHCKFKNTADAGFCVGCGTEDFKIAPYFGENKSFPLSFLLLLAMLIAGVVVTGAYFHSQFNDPENLRSNLQIAALIGIVTGLVAAYFIAGIINSRTARSKRKERGAALANFNLEKIEDEIAGHIQRLSDESSALLDGMLNAGGQDSETEIVVEDQEEIDNNDEEYATEFESEKNYDEAVLESMFENVGETERHFYETVEAKLALRRVQQKEIFLLKYQNEAVFWYENENERYFYDLDKSLGERVKDLRLWEDEYELGEGNRYFATFSGVEENFTKRVEDVRRFYEKLDDGKDEDAVFDAKLFPFLADENKFSETSVKKLLESYEKSLREIEVDYKNLKPEVEADWDLPY